MSLCLFIKKLKFRCIRCIPDEWSSEYFWWECSRFHSEGQTCTLSCKLWKATEVFSDLSLRESIWVVLGHLCPGWRLWGGNAWQRPRLCSQTDADCGMYQLWGLECLSPLSIGIPICETGPPSHPTGSSKGFLKVSLSSLTPCLPRILGFQMHRSYCFGRPQPHFVGVDDDAWLVFSTPKC